MYFDGWKHYFKTQKPTEADLSKYELFELTSGLNYNPYRRYSRCIQGNFKLDIVNWRSRLSLPTFELLSLLWRIHPNLLIT